MGIDQRKRESAVLLDHALWLAWRARPRMLTTASAAGFNQSKLDSGDVDALDQLASAGVISMSDLARNLRIDPSTATRTVDRLVAKGLATRRRNTDDSRMVLVSLTPAGDVSQTEAVTSRTELAARLIKRLDNADQDEIGRLWPALASAIDAVLSTSGHKRGPWRDAVAADQPTTDDRHLANAMALGQAWQVMRRARSGIVVYVTLPVADLRLESGEIDTLAQVASAGGAEQMSELANGLQITASSATKAVGRLIKKGLAARTPDPNDGRVVRVMLTRTGAQTNDVVKSRRLEFAIEVLDHFEPDDVAIFGHMFSEIGRVVAEEFGASTSSC